MMLMLAILAQEPFDIRPDPEADWGASVADVRKVLEAAGRELRKHCPAPAFKPILVRPRNGPITYFKRGPHGEYRVDLNVTGTYWSQYTFQFAHELGHILCGSVEAAHRQKWFEESVCEAASLFVLRRSAETWKTDPPYPNWKDYSKSLAAYADDRLQKAALPEGKSLAAWFAESKSEWEKNAEDRARNLVIAAQLLPLFEKRPAGWEALAWLNAEKLPATASFADLLDAWERHCPEKHKGFVRDVRRLFLVK